MVGTDERTLSSPARRHFLSAAAGLTGKVVASVSLAATLVPSSVNAERHGRHHGGGPDGPHCFLAGTRILMRSGETRIEDIRIGDRIRTANCDAAVVKWIGRSVFRKSGRWWPENVMPIRVSRSAISDNVPHEDLYLSPGHALFLNDFLIPVRELLNGRSIKPAIPTNTEIIEYYHIILETHEIIWAEGLPAETFLARRPTDIEKFTNFVEYERLYPNDPAPRMPVAENLGRRWTHLAAAMSRFTGSHHPLDREYDRIALRALDLIEDSADQFQHTPEEGRKDRPVDCLVDT